MAAIEYSKLVAEHLKTAYKEKYGGSPSLLIAALHDAYPKELELFRKRSSPSSQRDLISDKTIRNFFGDTPPPTMQEKNLNYLCGLLLSYKSYREAEQVLSGKVVVSSNTTLDEEWQETYRQHLYHQYGTIKILDMTQPVDLHDSYIEVRLSESVNRLRQRTMENFIAELEAEFTKAETLDRLGIPEPDKTLTGVEAVEKYPRLVVLGAPGSGKTTFLKSLAMRFVMEAPISTAHEQLIPVYISLKDVVEAEHHADNMDLTSVVCQELGAKEPEKIGVVHALLEQGKLLVLLDGLDEVTPKKVNAVCRGIDSLVKLYPHIQIVMTCRSAANESAVFQNFTTVEMLKFNTDQIEKFVHHWFEARSLPEYRDKFLSELRDNPAVSELTQTPLLLAMLCNSYEENGELPSNRHSLYYETVEALLRRWDTTRRIERHEHSKDRLTRSRKMNLFSKIAYGGFNAQPQRHIWRRTELEEVIRNFMEKLPMAESNPSDLDSQRVLQEIEQNHGLLVEQAKGFFSFPHLTFQEFFTAHHILDNPQHPELRDEAIHGHVTDPAWREVFLVIVGRLAEADEFIHRMFQQVYHLVQRDTLQTMLRWLHQKTQDWGVASPGWRAFYAAIDQDTPLYTERQGSHTNRSCAYSLATNIRHYNRARDEQVPATPWTKLISGLAAIHVLADDHVIHQSDAARQDAGFTYQHLIGEGELYPKLQAATEVARTLNLLELAEDLTVIERSIPEEEADAPQWQSWTERLRLTMVKRLDVGHSRSLPEEDLQAWQQYLYGCNLMLDCLQGDSVVSKEVRDQVISNLLLPEECINPL